MTVTEPTPRCRGFSSYGQRATFALPKTTSAVKQFFLLALCLLFLTSACGNQEDDCGAEGIVSLDTYIEELGLADEVQLDDDSGLRYRILEPGAAERPTPNSRVTVMYEGRLSAPRDEQIFDQTPPGESRTFALNSLIEAWQIGIPLVGAGGRIQLFVPANLAYGPNSIGIICANSDLIFDITLVEWQD